MSLYKRDHTNCMRRITPENVCDSKQRTHEKCHMNGVPRIFSNEPSFQIDHLIKRFNKGNDNYHIEQKHDAIQKYDSPKIEIVIPGVLFGIIRAQDYTDRFLEIEGHAH